MITKYQNLILIICIMSLSIPFGTFAADNGNEAGTTHAEGESAHGGGGGLLDAMGLDPKTLIIQALGFVIVLLVLNKFVFGRVGGLLEDRQKEIVARMNKLEADQKELDALTAQTRQRLNEMETESQAKIQSAIEDGRTERQRIVDEARQQATAEIERARIEIQHEKDQAILELRGIVAEIAIGAASQIIDQQLDIEGHQHIIDEYVRRLPSASN